MIERTTHARRLPLYLLATAMLVGLAACSVPFNVTTETVVITLNNTYGLTVEDILEVPADARRNDIEYDKVAVHYSVTANNQFVSDVDVTLYVSKDTTADNSRDAADETIVQRTVSPGETVSGTAESDVIESVLDDRQTQFVVGGSVSGVSLPTGAEVTIEMYAKIEGNYRAFP